MLTHLLFAMIGSGVFLRIVAKEKNRRERHLILRFTEQEKRLTEQEAAEQAQAEAESGNGDDQSVASEEPVEAKVIGQAA